MARDGCPWRAAYPGGIVARVAEETQRPRDEHGRFLPKDEPEQASADPQSAASSDSPAEGFETIDISDTVAPSVGPHTTVTRRVHEEGAGEHAPSDVDAMGLDKRREVMGQSYGPSLGKQAMLYGITLAVLAALVIGGKVLADKLDEPPATVEDTAPWAAADAQQRKPAPIDFPRYGGIKTESETAP
jgi:hypothetical protein